MATLVLSTVGTALGGPIGGAIGALVGQSFDQQLLAPASRGPRVGDLAVQTSSYGTQVPRLYGAMRVAGSVIWATDLVESEQTTGAKGQPDVTFSYSVSLAVALSSRPLRSIGRIWADGKLLRGAAGDFKVATSFRFYDGSEDQIIDPLIGSVEGIASTPAYRGLALAVFENLELADFGNRIPFLTFEAIGDDQPPTLATILADASQGVISAAAEQPVGGYAAYGRTIRTSVEPLVEAHGLCLFDDGVQLRMGNAAASVAVPDQMLGNSADPQACARFHREQLPASTVPDVLRITYYDPARDYQAGEARAEAGRLSTVEVARELPAVLAAGAAKSLVHDMLARAWAQRDRLTVRLPPSQLSLEPGQTLELDLTPALWTVESCTVDGFVIVAELRPLVAGAVQLSGSAGRAATEPDAAMGAMTVAVIDVPDVAGSAGGQPTLLIAASSSTAGWKRSTISIACGGRTVTCATPRRKSLLGTCLTTLASGCPDLIDGINSVDVQLVDPDQWLTSCDDDALAAGCNLAVAGNELIQFGVATALGAGRFRLSRLLRGRMGTEWASDSHVPGQPFCLLEAETLVPIALPDSAMDATVTATPRCGASTQAQVTGEAIRPPAPVRLACAFQPDGDLAISWVRRSRRGWAWTDEIETPLGEAREQYRVTVDGAAGSAEFSPTDPAVTVPAAVLATLGAGPALISVRQIGDLAASRPATSAVTLS